MAWPRHQILHGGGFLNHPPPLTPRSPLLPPPPPHSPGTRISPALLVIIVVLAVLFFISGLLHLLFRFLTKNPNSSSSNRSRALPETSNADALQRQLQQLFNLHDSGLDQAFIDSLPVFLYKEIVGPKEPFDCAVCLSEFSEKDKLRLLPTCSHAFHINCIDTWLLSNSTCPLCRGTLFAPGFSMENPTFEFDELPENGFSCSEQKRAETEEGKGDRKGVIPVRLGKFRKSDGETEEVLAGEASNSYLDARRCYSMGSYEYVLGNTNLRVALCPPDQRDTSKKVLNGADQPNAEDLEGKRMSSVCRGDSYSVSKTWLWKKKKGAFSSSSSAQSQISLPPLSTELSGMERARNE